MPWARISVGSPGSAFLPFCWSFLKKKKRRWPFRSSWALSLKSRMCDAGMMCEVMSSRCSDMMASAGKRLK